MKVFYTTSTQHLRIRLPFDYGKSVIARFSDGEIFVKIEEDVKNKNVWVIAATPAPADNYFELFLLLDALKRAGARINLLITYFGYARQDNPEPETALGAQVVSNIIKQFDVKKITVIHPHSTRLHEYVSFESIIPFDLFTPIAQQLDVIVAPDFGAQELAQRIGNMCRLPTALIEKKRTGPDQVEVVSLKGHVRDKKVLIVDDMIDTGGTVIKASNTLKEHGAQEVYAMATHGLFAGDALDQIKKSNIKKVYVTNSLRQPFRNKKVEVVDIAPLLERLIKE